MAKNTEDTLALYANDAENVQETKITKVTPRHVSNKDVAEAAQDARDRGDMPTLGWQSLDVQSLPTRGDFYPEGTKIWVRSATGGEIKHWSTINPNDTASIDAAMSYVVERCCKISIPGIEYMGGNWKDLIDIDRLYILFAIRDLTFIKGENELLFPISETKTIPIVKDNIDFITIPDEVMKLYDDKERCFKLKFRNGKTINMYLTSLGVGEWLKRYLNTKQETKENFDMDFVQYAPFLIKSHRKFSTRAYEMLVDESDTWTAEMWSAIAYIRDILIAVSNPTMRYNDETGVEQTAPLTFLGGIKSIFCFSNPLSGLL